jgi:uncharacterized membrane protein
MISSAPGRDIRQSKSDVFAVAILFFTALLLRFYRLFDLDAWFDESAILFQIEKSYGMIWNFCKTENLPPLYPWILKFWDGLFPGLFSLRFFSAILGALAPIAAYWLGKTLFNRKLGWMLGSACVLSVSLIHYSQMVRSYCIFPFFAALSVFGLVRAGETNRWRYWILTAVANTLGFYTHLFMLFLIAAELLWLVWINRQELSLLIRPLLAHLPAAIVMALWMIPMMQRYGVVQEAFYTPEISKAEIVKLWVFWGTGTDFRNQYLITSLLNLPFLAGLTFCLLQARRDKRAALLVMALVVPVVLVYALSWMGTSIFFKRYFIFLLPIYLAAVFYGFENHSRTVVRRTGMILTAVILLSSAAYYYHDYYEEHQEYTFIKAYGETGRYDGHAITRLGAMLKSKLQTGEVVVHYSNQTYRSFSFFPSIYYNHRSLPEYLYSQEELPAYLGRQYLQPGDQIRSLYDLKPLPASLWIVTLDSAAALFNEQAEVSAKARRKQTNFASFMHELKKELYQTEETREFGRITALHLRRNKAE